MIILEWDESKREANILRHKIDFADLQEVFESETGMYVDERFEYGEDRLRTLGLFLGDVIAIIHTETIVSGNSIIRIISARRADKYEQKDYFKNIRD